MRFIVLAAVLACAYASPQYIAYNGYLGGPAIQYSAAPIQYAAAPIQFQAPVVYQAPAVIAPAVTKTQYHAQDELGQASWGYAHPGQAKAELRDAAGNVRGSYAYVDPNGKEVRVNYVADAVNGFQVESNALPVAPAVPVTEPLVAPLPVQDTKEVAEAKAAHAKAVEEAKVRNAEADKKEAAEKKDAVVAEGEAAKSRTRRGLAYTVAAPLAYSAVSAPVVYAASPVVSHQAIAYSNVLAPQAIAVGPVREATLTKIVNTPGHAVSYRVD